MTSICVRFAPSPTGRLHVGNGRVALVNWLFARSNKGKFILRHDDTDIDRSGEKYIKEIEESLTWLGTKWDSCFRQSERHQLYEEAVNRLKSTGYLYPCYETPEELSLKRKAQLSVGKPPVYDRSALTLTDEEREKLENEGHRPHWRFRLDSSRSIWNDLIHGEMSLDPATMSDPVLIREDGSPLYTLTSVVDDADLGITHIIRGDDHLSNTAIQIQLFNSLDKPVPTFGHLALLVGSKGENLSKRLGSISLDSFREEGIEPIALSTVLAGLGCSKPVQIVKNIDQLISSFNISDFGLAPAKFDSNSVKIMNGKILQIISYGDVRERLDDLASSEISENFWNAIRSNINSFNEVQGWIDIVFGPLDPVIDQPELSNIAADLLPSDPWNDDTWAAWTGLVAKETGATGKKLFHPLRLALTAREDGPAMKNLLPLIGPERADARLRGKKA